MNILWVIVAFLALIILIILISQLIYGIKFGAEEKIYYTKQIVEFCNDAKEAFKNCNERSLNVITIGESGDYSFDKILKELLLPENVKKYNRTPEVDNLLELANTEDGRKKIREVVGFYNIKKQYTSDTNCRTLNKSSDDCGTNVGTYVTDDAFDIIFNNSANLRTKLENIRDKNSGEFHWSKGTGKMNIKKVVEKLSSQGVKFLILDAAGGAGLVQLYETYGFKLLATGYKKNIFDDEWELSQTSLMYGTVDEIARKVA